MGFRGPPKKNRGFWPSLSRRTLGGGAACQRTSVTLLITSITVHGQNSWLSSDRRLTGTVDLGTIDWIWDEYIKHSTGGRHYSQGYRPTDPDHVRQFFEGYERSYDLQEWLDRLRRLPTGGAGKIPSSTGTALKAISDLLCAGLRPRTSA